MRKVDISLGLIQKGDVYFLQLRDGDPKIGAAGLIGCFGGKIGKDERAVDAAAREINEETSLSPRAAMFKKLGEVKVVSDHQLEPVSVHARVFHILLEAMDEVIAKEGQLVAWTKEEVQSNLHKLTPATRAVFEELIVD